LTLESEGLGSWGLGDPGIWDLEGFGILGSGIWWIWRILGFGDPGIWDLEGFGHFEDIGYSWFGPNGDPRVSYI